MAGIVHRGVEEKKKTRMSVKSGYQKNPAETFEVEGGSGGRARERSCSGRRVLLGRVTHFLSSGGSAFDFVPRKEKRKMEKTREK